MQVEEGFETYLPQVLDFAVVPSDHVEIVGLVISFSPLEIDTDDVAEIYDIIVEKLS